MTELKTTSVKTQSNKKNGSNGPSLTKFPQVEVLAALYDMDDLMNRCLAHTFYLTLGDIGLSMRDNVDFEGGNLEFGIERRYLTPEVMDTLHNFTAPDTEFTDKGFSYTFGRIPVKVRFIERQYNFFKNPEKVIYGVTEFQIPNPYDNYYKTRWIIQ